MPDLRVLVCEGKDDLAALRVLFRAAGAQDVPRDALRGPLAFQAKGFTVEVHAAGGKDNIADRLLMLAQGAAATRPSRIAACFDPDRDIPELDRGFLKRDVRFAAAVAADFSSVQVGHVSVPLALAAWRAPSDAVFDSADGAEHDLERVLIAGLLTQPAQTADHQWAEATTSTLLRLRADHGWKRALRILNAWHAPQVADESFVDRLLQMSATKDGCLRALQASPVGALVRQLVEE